MTKQKLPLAQAAPLARRIVDALAPGCERIEIAGSIRRQKPEVGDIEIVCIPRRQSDLFGNPAGSLLDPVLAGLVQEGRLLPGGKNGENFKQFIIPATGTQLDLFITSPECWPVIFTIRTGSADFSRRLVTPVNQGGLLPSHLRVAGGRVVEREGGEPLALGDEAEFLALCGGWVEPEERK